MYLLISLIVIYDVHQIRIDGFLKFPFFFFKNI